VTRAILADLWMAGDAARVLYFILLIVFVVALLMEIRRKWFATDRSSSVGSCT